MDTFNPLGSPFLDPEGRLATWTGTASHSVIYGCQPCVVCGGRQRIMVEFHGLMRTHCAACGNEFCWGDDER